MARKPRFTLPGVPQHVIQRGNNREPCFFAEEDCRRYLEILQEATDRNGRRRVKVKPKGQIEPKYPLFSLNIPAFPRAPSPPRSGGVCGILSQTPFFGAKSLQPHYMDVNISLFCRCHVSVLGGTTFMHTPYANPTLDALFSRTADASFAVDAESHILFANDAFTDLCRRSRPSLLGRTCCQIVRGLTLVGDPFCGRDCPVKDTLRQGERVKNFDLAIPHSGEDAIWVNAGAVCTPISFRPVIAVILLRPISLYNSVHRFMHKRPRGDAASVPESLHLTRREIQVFRCVAEGKSTNNIAGHLHISYSTTRNHIRNIFAKLGVHSRAEVVAHAYRYGLAPRHE